MLDAVLCAFCIVNSRPRASAGAFGQLTGMRHVDCVAKANVRGPLSVTRAFAISLVSAPCAAKDIHSRAEASGALQPLFRLSSNSRARPTLFLRLARLSL